MVNREEAVNFRTRCVLTILMKEFHVFVASKNTKTDLSHVKRPFLLLFSFYSTTQEEAIEQGERLSFHLRLVSVELRITRIRTKKWVGGWLVVLTNTLLMLNRAFCFIFWDIFYT